MPGVHMVSREIHLTRVDVDVLERALVMWRASLHRQGAGIPEREYSEAEAVLTNHAFDLADRLALLAHDFRDDQLIEQGVTSAEPPF